MPDLVRRDGSEKQPCVYAGIAVHALTAVPEHVAVVAGAIYTQKRHSERSVGRAERFGHNANHKLRRHIQLAASIIGFLDARRAIRPSCLYARFPKNHSCLLLASR